MTTKNEDLAPPKFGRDSDIQNETKDHSPEANKEEKPKDQQDQQLAYKDMSNCQYYTCTVLYFGLAMLGSCLLDQVDIIFEFVASISVNCLAFIFPSVFYLVGRNMLYKKR